MRNWALLLLNLAFVVLGFVMLPSDPSKGIVTIAFFGSCLAITLAMMYQWRLNALIRVRAISVVGGAKITPRRTHLYVSGIWMLVLGLVLYVFGTSYPFLFRLIGLFISLVGACLAGAALLGYLPRGHMRFDAEALEIGLRASTVRIPWDNIAAVVEGEYHMNPVLLIEVGDDNALQVLPPAKHETAMNSIATSRAWTGAAFMLMPSQYGLTLGTLSAAITQYRNDPAARATLKSALPAPDSIT